MCKQQKAALAHKIAQRGLRNKIDGIDTIALLYGGTSNEREVSINSATMVRKALCTLGYRVIDVDIDDTPIAQLMALETQNVDIVFNILHGGTGENGQLTAALELLEIPVCSSNSFGQSLAMDKWISKQIWQQANLPVAKGQILQRKYATFCGQCKTCTSMIASWLKQLQNIALPWFVKPVDQGSSFGTAIIHTEAEFAEKISELLAIYPRLLLEEKIDGNEYTVSIIDDVALPIIRIQPASGNYDYEAKYIRNDTGFFIPSGLDQETEAFVQSISKQAFELLSCSIWGRVDLMQDTNNNWYLVEVNTLPGMTDHSLVPQAAHAVGVEFTTLINWIIDTRRREHARTSCN